MIKTCVIPAAGKGERIKELTGGSSKELLTLRGKKLIEHAIEEAKLAGCNRIIVVTHPSKTDLNDYIQSKGVIGVYQHYQYGLADAIYAAKEYILDEQFLVILPDVIGTPNLSLELIHEANRRQKYAVAYQEIPGRDCSRYGIIRGYPQGDHSVIIRKIQEKPQAIDTSIGLGVVGRYILPKDLLKTIPIGSYDYRGELQLSEAINEYIKLHPNSFVGCELSSITVDGGFLGNYA